MIFSQYSFEFLSISLLVALVVDWLFGEPPISIHPVVFMGRYLGWTSKYFAPVNPESSSLGKYRYFFYGAFFWTIGMIFFVSIAFLLVFELTRVSLIISSVSVGIILSTLLSWRLLRQEVLLVSTSLNQSMDLAKNQLSRLVSRDVAVLSEVQIRESAIETLSENLNDSVVAPLFWFLIGGLPGAVLYRYANTADAMWGYRTLRNGRYWEWFGKAAAKIDDLLSWFPAILTALLIALVSKAFHLGAIINESKKTISPNGGWPMGAMAIAVGIKLTKPGVYEINSMGREAHAGDIEKACHISSKVVLLIAATIVLSALLGMLL